MRKSQVLFRSLIETIPLCKQTDEMHLFITNFSTLNEFMKLNTHGHCVCSVASVMSDSLRHYGLQPASLLLPWNSLGKNTGEGCYALIQGIFPTQGLNPSLLCLLYWQGILHHQSHLGSPMVTNIPKETHVSPLRRT